jgi:hypothetical protein
MPGAVEDGFWMVLLIVAFAFLWFQQRSKRRATGAHRTMSVQAIDEFSKRSNEAA